MPWNLSAMQMHVQQVVASNQKIAHSAEMEKTIWGQLLLKIEVSQ